VPEHAHDWPLLSLFVIGAYSNQTELGSVVIAGPSAVFYAAGAAHSNIAGPQGFEQIEIEFDPTWLRRLVPEGEPVVRFIGGRFGAAAQALARACTEDITEETLLSTLRQFFDSASGAPASENPEWFAHVSQRLKDEPDARIVQLAKEVKLHPSWLGTAYTRVAGESFQDTAARFRVERAVRMLRETDLPLAVISAETGFCDQSHMIRTFRRVLGRLPSAVREDRRSFRQG